jgi:hypothetical protein
MSFADKIGLLGWRSMTDAEQISLTSVLFTGLK